MLEKASNAKKILMLFMSENAKNYAGLFYRWLPMSPSGYTLPNLQTGCQQMGHPICQHFAQSADILSNLHTGQNVPRRAIPSADGTKCWQMGRPIWLRFAQSADRTSANGTSQQPTFCPICKRDVNRWDVPSANILSNLPTFCPICILDKMFPERPSHLPTGQHVGRWAVPSTDEPIWRHFAQPADGDVSRWHMPCDNILPNLTTFCPICILDKMFPEDGTKCWQIGRPICR